MLKKDEVSKYTVPKNALDMLEWPPYSSKYTAKDIPMTDSNIQPPSDPNAHVHADGTTGWATETTPNPVPGTEVTQTPGLIPETTTEGRPDLGPDTTYTENDGSTGTVAPPPYTAGQPDITEVPPTDYADAVDYQVDSMPPADMPVSDAAEEAHSQMMTDPAYAIATHEHQLNKIASMLEELCSRVISIEAKIMQHEAEHHGPDLNDPLTSYPEVKQ